MKKNKKVPPLIYSRKSPKQKVAKFKQQPKRETAFLDEELKFIRVVPSYPRDRLQRKLKALEDQLVFIKQISLHSSDGLKKRV